MRPRKAALLKGLKTYQGKPCHKCGRTLKYVANWCCKFCLDKNKELAYRLKVLKEEKARKPVAFIGSACKKCGCTARYISNRCCKLCSIESSTKYKEKRK